VNVPVFNGATTVTPAAQRSEAPRPQSASHEPVFTVPMEPPAEPVAQPKVQPHRNDRQPAPRKARASRDDEPVKARRDDDEEDRDDRDDDRPRATDERSAQLSAWMLQMLTPGATGLAVASTGVDITDPAARFADPTEGLQAQQNPAEGAALGRTPQGIALQSMIAQDPATQEAVGEEPPTRRAVDEVRRAVEPDPAALAERARSLAAMSAKTANAETANTAVEPVKVASESLISPALAAPDPAWAAHMSPGRGAKSDNALTTVNTPTQGMIDEAADAQRARLHEAFSSSMHQRAFMSPARGEVDLHELGRVSVSALTENNAVAIEVTASQSATAHALHAQAGAIAADVRAADIPVASMFFTGAGGWTPSDANPSGRDAGGHGGPLEGDAPAAPNPAVGAGSRRVRIVL
jgi:hypothetical protein